MVEAEQAVERYLKQTGRTRERFVKEIEALGFAEDEFKREMQWRLNVSRFIEYRFAMGVQVSEEEIAAYYKNEYTPQYGKLNPGAAVPPLEEVRQGMTRVVTTRKTNASMEQWLKQMRETLRVRWFDEAFKVAGGAR
jgi:hypothetical protein